MRMYLDCEFNEFKGALISMALVDENGREWYEVVPCEKPGPWVAEHVMPILGRGPVSIPLMQASLSAWLALYDSVHIVADWPEDIAHFCQALITGPGMRLNTPPLTMEVVRIDAESELPHNALADARGIRAALAAREPAEKAVADGYKQAATFLWDLLDDIDTAGDMAKGDDKLYRAIVERHQRRRFEVGSTDGHSLELKTDAMLAAAKEGKPS